MKKLSLMAVLVLAMAIGLGCPKQPTTGGPGSGREGAGPAGGEQGGAGGGAGDRGDVTSGDARGLKTIYFDFDKYNLRDDARRVLDANAEILRNNPEMNILIEGHCDERGTDEYNLALGERRAQAAREYLIRLGIDPSRINVISYGEERPVAPGHDEESWALNRRGEFVPR
ncbi:MAG TPA: peptidoglycan-associated lipoprotein Pal [bacterium]|nr:peptidoglycan-associated lipoprotein Pal [bacterium]